MLVILTLGVSKVADLSKTMKHFSCSTDFIFTILLLDLYDEVWSRLIWELLLK